MVMRNKLTGVSNYELEWVRKINLGLALGVKGGGASNKK